MKIKAMRSGVWFKALQRIDRALIDLTIKVAANIRSVTLTNGILSIKQKLQKLLETKHLRNLQAMGYPLAQKLSALAQKWGNKQAQAWTGDRGFVTYLAIMHINRLSLTEYKIKRSVSRKNMW